MSKTNDADFVTECIAKLKNVSPATDVRSLADAMTQNEVIAALLIRVLARLTSEDLPEYHAGGEAPNAELPEIVFEICAICEQRKPETEMRWVKGKAICAECRA